MEGNGGNEERMVGEGGKEGDREEGRAGVEREMEGDGGMRLG